MYELCPDLVEDTNCKSILKVAQVLRISVIVITHSGIVIGHFGVRDRQPSSNGSEAKRRWAVFFSS